MTSTGRVKRIAPFVLKTNESSNGDHKLYLQTVKGNKPKLENRILNVPVSHGSLKSLGFKYLEKVLHFGNRKTGVVKWYNVIIKIKTVMISLNIRAACFKVKMWHCCTFMLNDCF